MLQWFPFQPEEDVPRHSFFKLVFENLFEVFLFDLHNGRKTFPRLLPFVVAILDGVLFSCFFSQRSFKGDL